MRRIPKSLGRFPMASVADGTSCRWRSPRPHVCGREERPLDQDAVALKHTAVPSPRATLMQPMTRKEMLHDVR